MTSEDREYLFSYGTLREARVQQAVFGHAVPGTPDAVIGFRLVDVTITDLRAIAISGRATHTIIDPSPNDSDQVEGQVLILSAADLAAADAYEDAAYKRVRARLRSGGEAWVYVRAEPDS